jgi:glutaredoxin
MRILLVLALTAALARADLYTWKDAKGVTHFSSSPPSDASAKRGVEVFKSAIYPVAAPIRVDAPPTAPKGRSAPRVELYSTAWCPVCRTARGYLSSRGVAFAEFDVEKDTTAAARYRAYGGQGAVPFLVCGRSSITGFSAPLYEEMLAALR